MSSAPLPPGKQSEVDDLARAIQQAGDAEGNALAAERAATDDARSYASLGLVGPVRYRRAYWPAYGSLLGPRFLPQLIACITN